MGGMTQSGLFLQVKPVETGHGKREERTQQAGEGILLACQITSYTDIYDKITNS